MSIVSIKGTLRSSRNRVGYQHDAYSMFTKDKDRPQDIPANVNLLRGLINEEHQLTMHSYCARQAVLLFNMVLWKWLEVNILEAIERGSSGQEFWLLGLIREIKDALVRYISPVYLNMLLMLDYSRSTKEGRP